LNAENSPAILCLASYEKGFEFLRQAKREGCRVLLLTSLSLQNKAHWPMEALDDIFYMPDQDKVWDRGQTINAVSYLARTQPIDRIVPLDDFDLEMAAALREHLRVPGLGESQTRHFRDKLVMRMEAAAAGIRVPEFIHILHHGRVAKFMEQVPGPWVLKPRSMAGSIGIKKVHSAPELWPLLEQLGDMQSHYLLERYVPGAVFHVDSIVYNGEIRFAIASAYGRPPMDVSHHGGVFTTRLVERGSEVERRLIDMNSRVIPALGLRLGVTHAEYILGSDSNLYFLETAARVGGAHIADLIDHAAGINMWAEWARVEIAAGRSDYQVPQMRPDYGALMVCLARQETPDTSAYTDPEIVWRLEGKKNHVGFIVRHPDYQRVTTLLETLVARAQHDFLAVAPPRERPTD